MALDREAIRRAYFAPPREGPPDHIPTDEELIAAHERRMFELCLAQGGDPVAEGLGEHGSIVGGPDKPARILTRSPDAPEFMVPIEPMPLTWFDYPEAHRSGLDPDLPSSASRGHPLLRGLLHAHAAGIANRPTPAALARSLRAETVTEDEAADLYNIFGCMDPTDFCRFLWDEGLSLYEYARAIHHSGVRRNHLVRWLHLFAVDPNRSQRGMERCSLDRHSHAS